MGQKLAEKEPLGQSVMHLILEFMISCQCKQKSKQAGIHTCVVMLVWYLKLIVTMSLLYYVPVHILSSRCATVPTIYVADVHELRQTKRPCGITELSQIGAYLELCMCITMLCMCITMLCMCITMPCMCVLAMQPYMYS